MSDEAQEVHDLQSPLNDVGLASTLIWAPTFAKLLGEGGADNEPAVQQFYPNRHMIYMALQMSVFPNCWGEGRRLTSGIKALSGMVLVFGPYVWHPCIRCI